MRIHGFLTETAGHPRNLIILNSGKAMAVEYNGAVEFSVSLACLASLNWSFYY